MHTLHTVKLIRYNPLFAIVSCSLGINLEKK